MPATRTQMLKAARREVKRAKRALSRIEESKPINHRFEKVTLILFARIIKGAQAATVLAQKGFAEDAALCVRTMYELFQQIAFINVDPKKRERRLDLLAMEYIYDQWEDVRALEKAEAQDPKIRTQPKSERFTRKNQEIREQYERIMRDPAYDKKLRPKTKAKRNNLLWRDYDADSRLRILRDFFTRIEGKAVTRSNLLFTDFCVRVEGNRIAHGRLWPLKKIPKEVTNEFGRRELHFDADPSTEGVPGVLLATGAVLFLLTYCMTVVVWGFNDDEATRMRTEQIKLPSSPPGSAAAARGQASETQA